MKTALNRISAILISWLVFSNALVAADDRARHVKILTEAETRLKAIYDQREFAPATFSGKWLRDSSGYLVLEKPKDGSEPELVQYDAASGNRQCGRWRDALGTPAIRSGDALHQRHQLGGKSSIFTPKELQPVADILRPPTTQSA